MLPIAIAVALLTNRQVNSAQSGQVHAAKAQVLWRVFVGHKLEAFYPDRRRHRVLIAWLMTSSNPYSHDNPKADFRWVTRYGLRAFSAERQVGGMFSGGHVDAPGSLLNIDPEHSWAYFGLYDPMGSSYATTWRERLGGRHFDGYPELKATDKEVELAYSDNGRTTYRVAFPAHVDMDDPDAYVEVVKNQRVVQNVSIGRIPLNIFVAHGTGRFYAVYWDHLATLSGGKIKLPPVLQVNQYNSEQTGPNSRADTDATGRYAYMISPEVAKVFKVSLRTGAIVSQRTLGFLPSFVAVDPGTQCIYLNDRASQVIVAIKLF